MIDVYNGSMASVASIVTIASLGGAYLYYGNAFKFSLVLLLSMILIGSVAAFWLLNRYPARVFAGDTGSLTVGAAIGLIAVLTSIEFIVIVALIPMIMNSFSILSSVGGLKERREMKHRAVLITEDYKLQANPEPEAPVTLARLVLKGEPMTEFEAVRGFVVLTLISGALAVFSGYLLRLAV